MTAKVERYDVIKKDWISHNKLCAGKVVKGVLPNSEVLFEASMLSQYKGFTTIIDKNERLVAPDEPAVEYWRKNPINKRKYNKFRLIPT